MSDVFSSGDTRRIGLQLDRSLIVTLSMMVHLLAASPVPLALRGPALAGLCLLLAFFAEIQRRSLYRGTSGDKPMLVGVIGMVVTAVIILVVWAVVEIAHLLG
jgi:hypothetical protein